MKNGWTDDKESTERTIAAMEYNLTAKQAIIEKLLAENYLMTEWLKKSAQMAKQQYDGGENVPIQSAWEWLHNSIVEII
jgi:hypothetical protein